MVYIYRSWELIKKEMALYKQQWNHADSCHCHRNDVSSSGSVDQLPMLVLVVLLLVVAVIVMPAAAKFQTIAIAPYLVYLFLFVQYILLAVDIKLQVFSDIHQKFIIVLALGGISRTAHNKVTLEQFWDFCPWLHFIRNLVLWSVL